MAYDDLRDWIAALDRAGELRKIRTEVDPILEIAEITDRVSKGQYGKAAGEGARSTRAMSICGNSEVHCDARLGFHGLAVLDVGLEVPLLHRLASRGSQDARATENL